MRQANREKLSITIEPRLYALIERHAARAKVPKSAIVEDAIRLWERSRTAVLAREGYRQFATEDIEDAEAYLAVLDEIEER